MPGGARGEAGGGLRRLSAQGGEPGVARAGGRRRVGAVTAEADRGESRRRRSRISAKEKKKWGACFLLGLFTFSGVF